MKASLTVSADQLKRMQQLDNSDSSRKSDKWKQYEEISRQIEEAKDETEVGQFVAKLEPVSRGQFWEEDGYDGDVEIEGKKERGKGTK